jgi:Uma2 family endonuclease
MTAMLEKPQTKTTTEAPLELMRFTGERYDQLWKIGFITSDDRVELLNGQIVRKPEMNPPHLYRVKRVYDRINRQFENRAVTIAQSTIRLPQDGRPEPDITLFKLETPEDRLPLPEDIYLVIEISDSTLTRDRETKLELYARDGITEYWIVNLEQNQLEVYRDPEGTRYATSFTVKNAIPTTCLAFPDDAIDWAS